MKEIISILIIFLYVAVFRCSSQDDVCDEDIKTGNTNCTKEENILLDGSQRYAYNRTSQQCVQFTYTGCGGNENNFYTRQECDNTCDDTNNLDEIDYLEDREPIVPVLIKKITEFLG